MPFEADTMVVRCDGFSAAPLDDEIVILNSLKDCYIALDEIGRLVWERLESPRRFGDLCRQFAEEFDGPADEISRDLQALLEQLSEQEMVRILVQPFAGPA